MEPEAKADQNLFWKWTVPIVLTWLGLSLVLRLLVFTDPNGSNDEGEKFVFYVIFCICGVAVGGLAKDELHPGEAHNFFQWVGLLCMGAFMALFIGFLVFFALLFGIVLWNLVL